MDQPFSVGTTVRARGQRWQVVAAEPLPQKAGPPLVRLRLRSLEGALAGDELPLLHPIDQVELETIPELRLDRPGRAGRFRLLHEAFLLDLAPTPDTLVAAARSRVALEPYQHVPALRSLAMARPRLLIADDVGLGKTIEAGLVLRELNTRRRARRVLIVCPASLMTQWQEELEGKFGFSFAIFDRDGIQEVKQGLEAGANLWAVASRVIASMDFIKRREGPFRELAATRWDVVIVDEAHHLAAGRDEDDVTDRHRLGRWLAEAADGLFLLTATPHDGYDETFLSLLQLLDPRLVPPGETPRFEVYKPHLVRRLKRHIRLPDGREKFAPRLPPQPVPVRLQEPELRLHEAVLAEAGRLDQFAAAARHRPDTEAIRLVATVLRKRAASSRAALEATLAERRKNLEERAEEVELRREYLRALRRGDTIPDTARRQLEREAHLSYLAIMRRLGTQIRRMEEEQEALIALEALLVDCEPVPETKMGALHAWLQGLHADAPEAKVIAFSEYEDTVNAVADSLRAAGYADSVITLSGELTRPQRDAVIRRFGGPQTRILVATDAAGEGLNLHKHCHHLVHFDLPWNPNRLEQRNGRIDRYGQPHPPIIAYLYASDTYDGELLDRLIRKLGQQIARLGSVGDVLGQLQAERIETLLRQAPVDVRGAVEQAERELDDVLNRAAAAPLLDRVGPGELNTTEMGKVEGALVRGRAAAPPLDAFLERAVRAAGGAFERRGDRIAVVTPQAWLGARVAERYELRAGVPEPTEENLPAKSFIHEDHPLLRTAIRWVRASRYDPRDDHRLAYSVTPGIEFPDLVATYLVTLRDGDGAEIQRLEAIRALPDGSVDGDREAALRALWAEAGGNVAPGILERLYGPWWGQARESAEGEARRRATSWRQGILALRRLEYEMFLPEHQRWERAVREAILGDAGRAYAQPGLFDRAAAIPPKCGAASRTTSGGPGNGTPRWNGAFRSPNPPSSSWASSFASRLLSPAGTRDGAPHLSRRRLQPVLPHPPHVG
jgi:superfamily II DNA or RNA helicase